MERLIIRGGRVLDPASNIDGEYSVYVVGGRIAALRPAASDTDEISPDAPGVTLIDATGLIVIPGLIDLHTHLREPGYEYKETIRSGTEAAKAGGFTTILCMANTDPPNDNESVTRYIIKKAESSGIRVLPVGAVTQGLKGRRLAGMAELKAAGCVAFSDDGEPLVDSGVMRRALEYSRIFNMPVISHAEDPSLVCGGVMNEGVVSTRLGLKGIPNAAEEAMAARDIALAELTGGRLHIAHVSAKGTVELVRMAKKRGLNVTAEATPHHMTLTDEAVDGYDTNAKMNPPLRSQEDVEALRAGVKDGAIDAIATDHAPHSVIEKDVEFDRAANGIIGLETAFSLIWGLVEEGVFTITEAIRAMTVNPAKAVSIDGGTLKVGKVADITLVDPARSWKVEPGRLKSRSKNTPWADAVLKGVVVKTIAGGKIVYGA